MVKLKDIYFQIRFQDYTLGYSNSPKHFLKECCNKQGYLIKQFQVIPCLRKK